MTLKLPIKNLNHLPQKVKTPDASKAKKDLDFKLTVSPEEGIRRTVEWFKKLYGKPRLNQEKLE